MATPVRSVVIVEPLESVGRAFVDQATVHGVFTTWCRDGAEALLALGAANPTALVLAAATPVIPAHTVVEVVRARWRYPVLIGVGPGDDESARRALQSGASGTVARPYDISEVLARLEPDRCGESQILLAGPISLDLLRHEVRVDGHEVQLTSREMRLLAYLVGRQGQVSSQEEISRAVWGAPTTTNTVAVHVNRIRTKLGDQTHHGPMIRTIRGVGYRLAPTLCAPTPPHSPTP